MNIFYAVQATGNGHISRAIEILPHLSAYGNVDVFLSGNNYALQAPFKVAYRSKGVGFYYNYQTGKVDFLKTFTSLNIPAVIKEAQQLPVEKYDLVINDFESITSLACRIKNVQSVHFGHQASFSSELVPRPKQRSVVGEWVIANFVKAQTSVGLHFLPYDKNIFSPIIKSRILNASPTDKGHITVYLGQFHDEMLVKQMLQLQRFTFHIFSTTCQSPYTLSNVSVFPINNDLFTESLIHCHGMITGAGFESPAEALYMQKKLMVIPLKGQYEQLCNAEALLQFGVVVLPGLDDYFPLYFNRWIFNSVTSPLKLTSTTHATVERVVFSGSD